MSSEENSEQPPKKSFVTEEEAENATKEDAVNELLQMSPLSRLVLSVEQIAKEMNLTRLELEKLNRTFADTKAVAPRQTVVIKDTRVPDPAPKPVEKPSAPNALIPPPQEPAPEPKPQAQSTMEKVAKFKEKVGPEVADMLTFDTDNSANFITIKPKKFLGTENFKVVCAAAKDLGGDYIPAGKDSRWQIPKLV
jgi:hypothetical protein